MEAFNNELKKEIFARDKMNHVEKVYKSLNCESFKDYHLTYLKTDVILLADVFEKFRKVCLNYYNLDPANYLSSPALAWDAALLKTNINLELIHDLDILNMIERGKRGGLCFVGSKRHVKANNKYLDNYDSSKPSNYLMYWDANNLYGWSMVQPLPYKDLKFRNDINIEQILKNS
jgi:single-stranded DNA-specific DHH superfamily exonuclease